MERLTRRGFLGGLLAVVSAPAIVRVESLMALPAPAKLIIPQEVLFEQASIVWQSGNNLLTVDMITREAVKLFQNSNAFIQELNAEYEKDRIFMQGAAHNNWQWKNTNISARIPLLIRRAA